MESLTTYRARDRRVYNGAFCSDMQREANHTKNLEDRMKRADPSASCVYFPGNSPTGYLVFINTMTILTNNFHVNKQEALIEAITILENKHNTDTV
jgi:hypothetical protein